ncbi:Uncharacterized helicase C694.02 [Taphrina deformans PYCC 5710]|uniref:Uncharacterized helicase C694.02 n=1 Tax=Taphrina deformans (strain PYCC 5710 / ATCC 11124 / CBS 356.35 / IMI 108563 / JCM 9778 / NBRC 8474) TaxID=1097556 RepID=R4X740_TAPDE|nr:Uncharacterized helicase C694.02 [Taphrina deformans PYCC 5710]|eukprot:CCG81092.1 Uncharacterized helicase C694.02 [Taphrina deformans PYCC 5710]
MQNVEAITQWWHAKAKLWSDITERIGDELVYIDGDALLKQVFEDEHVKLQDAFQLLPAVAVLERKLLKLRNLNYHIVFVESHAKLSTKDVTALKLARACIITHLLSIDSISVYRFAAIEAQECQEYLDVNRPYFVITSDGDSVAAENETFNAAWRAAAYAFLQKGMDVACFEGMENFDGKIFAFSIARDSEEIYSGSLSGDDALKIENVAEMMSNISISTDATSVAKVTVEKTYNSSQRRSVFYAALQACGSAEEILVRAALLTLLRSENDTLDARVAIEHTKIESVEVQTFLNKFYTTSSSAAEELSKVSEFQTLKKDIADYFDSVLFVDSLLKLVSDSSSLDKTKLQELVADFTAVANITMIDTPTGLLKSLGAYHATGTNGKDSASDAEAAAKAYKKANRLLPFSDPLFDRYLQNLELDTTGKDTVEDVIDFASIPQQVGKRVAGMEKKLLEKEKGPELTGVRKEDIWIKKRFQANKDRQMAHIKRAAESLTGVNGTGLERQAIISGQPLLQSKSQRSTPVPSRSSTPVPTENKKSTKKESSKKEKPAKLSKAEQIRLQNTAEKAGKKALKSTSAWASTKSEIDAYKDLKTRLDELDRYINSPAKAQRDVDIQLEMELYKIQILLDMWKKACKDAKLAKTDSESIRIAVRLFEAMSLMYRNKNLTTNIKEICDNVLTTMGLGACVDNDVRPTASKDISFDFDIPKSKSSYNVPYTSTEFQMKFCGEYMERNMESKPDPRTNFDADKWQRDVLDVIDREENVFVVAPTSAGKTFISFYAIEKVLRADDDGLLIFIAPTKALVNQMAAEIEARYSKNYRTQGGKNVWAIHSGDYKIHDPERCQVLVTVPQVLQKLLLSPVQAQRWSPKIKRIIFDEIHCIGGEEGTIWEQLLLLAPCPIVALSATVGNPDAFTAWLAATQAAHKRPVTLVRHNQRYSDLRKFVYIPAIASESEFMKGEKISSDVQGQLRDMHPASALHFGPRVMPDDLGFEPRDCYNIYDHMRQCRTPEFDMPEDLEPNKYFADKHFIRKADVVVYQAKIKGHLAKWLADPNSRNPGSPFINLMKALDSSLRARTEAGAKRWHDLTTKSVAAGGQPSTMLEEAIMPMLEDLDSEGLLPSLLFNYDRAVVESLGEKVLNVLEAREAEYRETDPAWQRKLKAYEKWLGDADKRQKEKERAMKRTKKNADKDEDAPEQPEAEVEEVGWQESFDPTAPDPNYSFVGLKNTYGDQDMADELARLEKRNACPLWMVRALRRGVGIHHSGLNRRYRQLVELAFRSKYLRVVICTGTLALGINMPATSAIFVGDGVDLTALNFRQAAGRAGRRGYDVLGHVGFLCVPMDKIDRLLVSRIPAIAGHYPVTTTLLLRLFNLLKNSNRSPFANKAIEGLFAKPKDLVAAIGDASASDKQILYHIRFSIEYLRREQLLDASGQPIKLAAPVSHLYYQEPSNFAFAALMRGGIFHSICRDFNDPSKRADVCKTLVLLLSYIFCRLPMRPSDVDYRKNTYKKSIGYIALPEMKEVLPKAQQCLDEHEQRAIQLYSTYISSFVATSSDQTNIDGRLPFSREQYNVSASSTPTTTARSVFANLSAAQQPKSFQELLESAPSGIFPEGLSPNLTIPNRNTTILNAYIYDFYLMGETRLPANQAIQSLVETNGIPKAQTWFVLSDFSTVLASIEESLSNMLGITDGEGFDIMSGADAEMSAFDEDEADNVPANPSVTTAQAAAPNAKARAQVEADWTNLDQSESDDDDNDSGYGGSNSSVGTYVYRDTKRVLRAFQLVRAKFNTSFKQMWA